VPSKQGHSVKRVNAELGFLMTIQIHGAAELVSKVSSAQRMAWQQKTQQSADFWASQKDQLHKKLGDVD
jgi:hypothetical protein